MLPIFTLVLPLLLLLYLIAKKLGGKAIMGIVVVTLWSRNKVWQAAVHNWMCDWLRERGRVTLIVCSLCLSAWFIFVQLVITIAICDVDCLFTVSVSVVHLCSARHHNCYLHGSRQCRACHPHLCAHVKNWQVRTWREARIVLQSSDVNVHCYNKLWVTTHDAHQ